MGAAEKPKADLLLSHRAVVAATVASHALGEALANLRNDPLFTEEQRAEIVDLRRRIYLLRDNALDKAEREIHRRVFREAP